MQPFSHPWHLSPYVVSSSGQRLVYLEICKVPITLLDTIFRKYVRVQKALCIQIQQALKQHGSAACKPMPRWHCREGRVGEEEKSIAFISICKAFLCSHVTDRHFAYFHLAIKPCHKRCFPFCSCYTGRDQHPDISSSKKVSSEAQSPCESFSTRQVC